MPTLTPSPDAIRDHAFERSFDFSKFPNIQEVTFGFWADGHGGCLPWVSMALSTLRPTASPHLSGIKLDFRSLLDIRVETMIADTGSDLRRIAGKVTRIKREFEETVRFTVLRDPRFRVVLGTLKVRVRFVWWKTPCGYVDSPPLVPCRSSSATFIETSLAGLGLGTKSGYIPNEVPTRTKQGA